MENDPVKTDGSSEAECATAGDFSRPLGSAKARKLKIDWITPLLPSVLIFQAIAFLSGDSPTLAGLLVSAFSVYVALFNLVAMIQVRQQNCALSNGGEAHE